MIEEGVWGLNTRKSQWFQHRAASANIEVRELHDHFGEGDPLPPLIGPIRVSIARLI